MGFTLDLLGEAAVSESEAHQYQQAYLKLLDDLTPHVDRWGPNRSTSVLELTNGRPSPRLNVSIKPTSLYSQIDPVDLAGSAQSIKERLRPILSLARRRGAFINLNMEHYQTKAITLRAFKEVLMELELRDGPNVGIAIQAYLRDTDANLCPIRPAHSGHGVPGA